MTADPGLRDRLQRLADQLPTFEAPGFTFGAWVPSTRREDGVIEMGWYQLSEEAETFTRSLGGWITPFDWPTWANGPEGTALLHDPPAVASASAEDLGKLLTSLVRGNRFSEGTLAWAHESGLLTAIMRRAAALLASDDEAGR